MTTARLNSISTYQVLNLIGTGGMAKVYRCQHPRTGRIVAVKVLQKDADAATLMLFEREIQAMQQLKHPYIVQMIDYHLSPTLSFLVMPYYPSTVEDRMAARLYSPEEASQVLTHLAFALDHAHNAGFIHCDIKPSNLMLDDRGQLYLADFGLAKAIGGSSDGRVFGTPPYLAPELADGALPDVRTDVYALGVTLFEMQTGHRPFEASANTDYFYLHRRALPPRPSQLNVRFPFELDQAVLTALNKLPSLRPQSAGEYARIFRSALDALPPATRKIVPPHGTRPSITYKPVHTATGKLIALNENTTVRKRSSVQVEIPPAMIAPARRNPAALTLWALLGVLILIVVALALYMLITGGNAP